ncbi:MAG: hypothetical protein ACYDGX_08765 [Thermoleophilia bacterium]
MAEGRQLRFLILDANVVIDFCQSDIHVLSAITSKVGQLFLATPVLDEVRSLDKEKCADLGIILVEPEIEHVVMAEERRGALSFEDHLCLILARDRGWTCVTNEKLLRKECRKEKISVVWGLELLAILHEQGGITKTRAKQVARAIHETNPRYISARILRDFEKQIDA